MGVNKTSYTIFTQAGGLVLRRVQRVSRTGSRSGAYGLSPGESLVLSSSESVEPRGSRLNWRQVLFKRDFQY